MRGRLADAADHRRRSSASASPSRQHYRAVVRALGQLDHQIPGPRRRRGPDLYPGRPDDRSGASWTPRSPIAVLFVGGYGGLGRHALLTLLAHVPGALPGRGLRQRRGRRLRRLQGRRARSRRSRSARARAWPNTNASRRRSGLPATSAYAVGTEVAVEAEQLAVGPGAVVPEGGGRRRPDHLRGGHGLEPHPPQPDRAGDPAPPAAAGRADDRACPSSWTWNAPRPNARPGRFPAPACSPT